MCLYIYIYIYIYKDSLFIINIINKMDDIQIQRGWMYIRLLPNKNLTTEFYRGVKSFIQHAKSQPRYLEDKKLGDLCLIIGIGHHMERLSHIIHYNTGSYSSIIGCPRILEGVESGYSEALVSETPFTAVETSNIAGSDYSSLGEDDSSTRSEGREEEGGANESHIALPRPSFFRTRSGTSWLLVC
ncbi:hypothetical protein ACJIZ3_006088 [Penstemon smallii]|uniref:Uncharacterized protein n=1 Tax=Penstemon smallii TaxID=265156 RepID=A0ABD3S761_9LAMI